MQFFMRQYKYFGITEDQKINDGGGKQIHLGYYGIKHEAQNAWINQKCEQILLALNKEEICQETKVYTDMLVTRLKGAIDAS